MEEENNNWKTFKTVLHFSMLHTTLIDIRQNRGIKKKSKRKLSNSFKGNYKSFFKMKALNNTMYKNSKLCHICTINNIKRFI